MRVLTVYAHPNPKSFCHAVLEQFNEGLARPGTRTKSLTRTRLGSIPFSAHETVRAG
jgi:NAD(P)H dehydrogenase (quinone)